MRSQFVFESERLLLRLIDYEDADYFFETWNDLDFRRFLFDDQPVAPEKVKQLIELGRANFARHNFGFWTLLLKETNARVGVCGLVESAVLSGEFELLFGIEKQFWGGGLATEASRAVLKYAFDALEIKTIFAAANPENIASRVVLEKIGMKFDRKIQTDIETMLIYSISR